MVDTGVTAILDFVPDEFLARHSQTSSLQSSVQFYPEGFRGGGLEFEIPANCSKNVHYLSVRRLVVFRP